MKKRTLALLLAAVLLVATEFIRVGRIHASWRQFSATNAAISLADSRTAYTSAEMTALREACYTEDPPEFDRDERETAKRELYIALFFGESDVAAAVKRLKNLGVHALGVGPVRIFYDAYLDTWEVGAGFCRTDIPKGFAWETELGGLDGFGILLDSSARWGEDCIQKDTWLYVSAGEGKKTTVSHAPTKNPDLRPGVYHEFADSVSRDGYYGKYLAVVGVYSAGFQNSDGFAEIVYKSAGTE